MTAAVAEPRIVPRQTWIGLTLAGMIVAGWAVLHVYGVYFHRWGPLTLVIAPAIVAVQTWLSVGLFIVAHDAMHGSLAPGRPRLNAAVGRLTLGLYAGFRFDRLKTAHHAH
ncbi:MAG: beta-carotene ketolase, partial [Brevundimonas sp.]|nr:beta-carotene ketolase [Brevundimonas sp.]